jgi:serine/threonine protein kinase
VRIPQVGENFGAFRVERLLGRGGMGAVFVANQVALNRPVALKVLLPQLAESEDYRRRFAREAAALASAQSPHIVPIFDYGEIDGALFIATQLVPGGDLGVRIKDMPMDTASALEVARDVATALADAHEAGVLHRDVKPSNVLLWDRQDGPHAYLCDFGIAKVEGTDHTTTEGVAGTWAFLSPERCNGDPATEASDIYSAGCVLWNMLTGTAPYTGSSVEMAMAHVSQPVPQLSGSGAVNQHVNQILAKSMAKDPLERFRSAGDLARELGSVRAQIHETEAKTATGPGGLDPEFNELSPDQHQPRLTRPWFVAALTAALVVGLISWVGVEQGWFDSNVARNNDPTASAMAAICWNGEPATTVADCSKPEGADGLIWVFPSLDVDSCEQAAAPVVPTKSEVFFCETSYRGAGVAFRYSAWDNVRLSHRHYTKIYPDEPVGLRSSTSAPRLTWREGKRDAEGFFRLSSAYVAWPFSVSIDAETLVAREWAFRQVAFRPEDQMTGISQEDQ